MINEKTYQNEYFKVGVISKTHGVKGEVKVFPTTDEPGRFIGLKRADLYINNVTTGYTLERARIAEPFVIVKFAGVDDIDTAERLKNAEIRIPSSMALPLSDDEYYVRDLIGMEVYDSVCGLIGVIENVIETGSNDVYNVRGEDGKEILIPAIKQCIINVDVKSRVMRVELMDGTRRDIRRDIMADGVE